MFTGDVQTFGASLRLQTTQPKKEKKIKKDKQETNKHSSACLVLISF